MYLCCVESLSGFRSKLDFLQNFKVAPTKACVLSAHEAAFLMYSTCFVVNCGETSL